MLSESERQLMGNNLAIEENRYLHWSLVVTHRENKVQELIEKSSKFEFLMQLLPNLYEEKHRVLLFSMSAKMLDLLELIIKARHPTWKFVRIDGSVDEQARHRKIEQFNKDSSIFLFLLTTKTGGVGLNLTGTFPIHSSYEVAADRAVILDPAWNNIDDQAVDRIYRIGQTKNVVVYRFITSGTIEEKIYKKQIFKASLFKNIIEQDQSLRSYFTKQELRDLFTLDDTTYSTTQQLLEKLYANKRVSDNTLRAHIKYLHSLGNFHS